MRKDRISKELTVEVIVGVFMVMIFLGLGYFTIILSRETWFGTKWQREIVFGDVMGLRDGDSVVACGMPVGKVRSLTLREDGVHVVVVLDMPLEFREGYRAAIQTTSVLGGRHLEISEGPRSGRVLDADETLRGQDAHDIMADASAVVHAVKVGLVEGGIVTNLQIVASGLRDVAERVSSGKGTFGRLFSGDESLYRDLAGSVSNLHVVAGRLARGDGVLGKLLSPDDSVYQDLASSVRSLRSIAARVEEGKGTVGKLFSADDRLYQDLSAAIGSLKTIAGRMERGEGTIGRLLSSDDSLYREIEQTIRQVHATIDDWRETTPVVNFTSIFFGAF
jgi:phospholipid/cholesterol/gamma-HCH transport system substrate-binding protein